MRVLVIKTSSMGDLVHTLPALTDALSAIPGIRFDWVCEPSFKEIPVWHPAVDDVIAVSLRRWRWNYHRMLFSRDFKVFKEALRYKSYDVVIDAQGLMKSAFLVTKFARGTKHGFSFRTAREGLSAMVYDRTHEIDNKKHAITRTRDLFAATLGYKLPKLSPNASINLKSRVETCNRLVLITQSSKKTKAWTSHAWRFVIEHALKQFKDILLPVGNEAEYENVEKICVGLPVNIAKKIPLTDLACKIKSARAVISIDTGLAHVADAIGKPLLILFGPTLPNLVGPVGQNSTIIKSSSSMMSDISHTDVIDWINRLHIASDESNQGSF